MTSARREAEKAFKKRINERQLAFWEEVDKLHFPTVLYSGNGVLYYGDHWKASDHTACARQLIMCQRQVGVTGIPTIDISQVMSSCEITGDRMHFTKQGATDFAIFMAAKILFPASISHKSEVRRAVYQFDGRSEASNWGQEVYEISDAREIRRHAHIRYTDDTECAELVT